MGNLGIGILLDFSANVANYSRGISDVSKGLTTLDSLHSQLSNKIKTSWKDGGLQAEGFSETIQKIVNDNENLSKTLIETSSSTANAFKMFSKSTQDFFQLNALNKYIQSVNTISGVMQNVIPGFVAKESKEFNDNLAKMANVNPKSFTKFAETTKDFVKEIDNYNPMISGKIVDLLNKFQDAKTPEELEKLNKKIQTLVGFEKNLKSMSENLNSFGKNMMSNVASAVGFGSMITDTLKAQDTIYKSTAKMGMVANKSMNTMTVGSKEWLAEFRKTASSYEDEVMNVAQTTTIKFHDAAEAFNAIAEERLPVDNLKTMGEITTTTVRMSQAFNISQTEAASFAADLMKIGGVNVKGLNQAADAMATLQANIGLTGAEARDVTSQVGSMMRQMRVLGKTPKDIGGVVSAVGRLQVAFKKAGLEAGAANDFINKMMNPDNLEENILLWSKSGISVAEGMKMATEGVTEDQQKKLAAGSQAILKMGGNSVLAQNELLKASGLTFQTVAGLQQVYNKGLGDTTKKATIEEAAESQRLSTMEQMTKMWNQMSLAMSKQLLPVLDKLASMMKTLVDGFSALVQKVQSGGKAMQIAFALLLADMLSFGKISGLVFKGLGAAFEVSGVKRKFDEMLQGMLKSAKTAAPKIGKEIAGAAGDIKAPKVTQHLTKSGAPDMRFKANRVSGPKAPVVSDGAAQSISKLEPEMAKGAKTAKGFAGSLADVGKGMLMIGAGVALVIGSIALLALAMKDLSGEQMVGLGATIAIVMAGMIGLGLVAKSTSYNIQAFGLGMLMIGGGVALVIGSVALLAKVIDGLNKPLQSALIAGGLALVMIAAIGALAIIAGPEVAALGIGFLAMGAGIALAVGSIALLLMAINGFTAGAGQIAGFIVTLTALVVAMNLLSPIALTAAAGFAPLSIALLAVGGAVTLVGAGVLLLSKGFGILIDSLIKFGSNIGSALLGTIGLSASLAILLVSLGAFAVGIALIAAPLLAGSVAILALSGSLLLLGAGTSAAGAGMNLLTSSSEKFINIDWKSIVKASVYLAAFSLVLAAVSPAATVAGASMLMLGLGLLSVSGSIAIISGSIKSMFTALTDLSKSSGTLKSDLKGVGSTLSDMLKEIDIKPMKSLIDTFRGAGDSAKSIATVSDAIGRLVESISKFMTATTGMEDLQTRLKPLGEALSAAFASTQGTIDQLGKMKGSQLKEVGGAFKGVGEGIGSSLGPLSEFVTKMKDLTTMSDTDMKKMTDNMKTMLSSIFASFNGLISSFSSLSPKQLEQFGGAFKGFGDGLQGVVGGLSSFYDKFSSADAQKNLNSASQNMKAQMKVMADIFNDFSNKVKGGKDSGEAFKSYGDGLKSFSDSLISLSGSYSQIEKMDFKALANQMSSLAPVISSFNKEISSKDVDIIKVTDSMKGLGDGITSLSNGMKQLSVNFTSTDVINKSISSLQENLKALSTLKFTPPAGMAQFSDYMKSLNSITQLDVVTASINKLSNALSDAKFSTGIDKFNGLMNSISTNGTAVVGSLNAMSDAIGKMDMKKFNVFDRIFGGAQKEMAVQLSGTTNMQNNTNVQGPDNTIFSQISKDTSEIKNYTKTIADNTSQANKYLASIANDIGKLNQNTRSSKDMVETTRTKR